MLNRAFVLTAADPDTGANGIRFTTKFFISGKQPGAAADRILNGENIGTVRYITASPPELTFNFRTARLTGLKIPRKVVAQAAQVDR